MAGAAFLAPATVADVLASWTPSEIADARRCWPDATDAQLNSALVVAESAQADGASWPWAVKFAVGKVRREGGRP